MDLHQLDDIIPKRWILLLRYYLPFFKKPAPFYFECRQFINHLKRTPYYHLLDALPDLLFILDTYSKGDVNLINLSQKIIQMLSPEQYQQIDYLLLRNIFLKFDPENNQTVILNQLLLQIPAKAYEDIISLLTLSNNKVLKLIKWCARLADKFTLEDKLNLILSLPEQLIVRQRNLLYALAFTELETCINSASGDIAKRLTCSEELVGFILKWQEHLEFSLGSLFILFNHYIEAENPLFLSYIKGLDIEKRFTFFKDLLAANNNTPKNNEKFLRLCPQVQRSLLVNKLIEYSFKSFVPELNEIIILNAKLLENNPCLLILRNLLENSSDYWQNPFQLLALSHLAGKSLELEKLKKINLDACFFLESAKIFSIKLQEYVAESSIKAIKLFIRENIMPEVPNKNERYCIHKRFSDFYNDQYPNTHQDPVEALEIIIKGIPEEILFKFKPILFDILLPLLRQLYFLLENPVIQRLQQKRLIAIEKACKEEEERKEARRQLQERIAMGLQNRVSFQRMEELYGQEAETVQEKWQKNIGIHFFDAGNEKELKMARQEAAELINLNREFKANYHYPVL